MAETERFLCGYPTVGNDTEQRRHKQADDTLHRVEPTDIRPHTMVSQIVTHAGQIRSPNGKLEEVH